MALERVLEQCTLHHLRTYASLSYQFLDTIAFSAAFPFRADLFAIAVPAAPYPVYEFVSDGLLSTVVRPMVTLCEWCYSAIVPRITCLWYSGEMSTHTQWVLISHSGLLVALNN
jgi:hypothetical protein